MNVCQVEIWFPAQLNERKNGISNFLQLSFENSVGIEWQTLFIEK